MNCTIYCLKLNNVTLRYANVMVNLLLTPSADESRCADITILLISSFLSYGEVQKFETSADPLQDGDSTFTTPIRFIQSVDDNADHNVRTLELLLHGHGHYCNRYNEV